MPLYEYKCGKCGEIVEVLQRFSDEPLKVHDGCGGSLERLLSPPAFQFKGSGWYITDYARKNNGKGETKASKDAGCCGESGKASESKASSESKN